MLNDTVGFKGEDDTLSNFFPCSVTWEGKEFKSSGHVYVYEKALKNHRPDIAVEVERLDRAPEVKNVSKKNYTMKRWEEENT